MKRLLALAVLLVLAAPEMFGACRQDRVYDVVRDARVSSSLPAATNTSRIQSLLAEVGRCSGSATIVFPSKLGEFNVSFDDVATQYYILFGLSSDMTVVMEPGAEMHVTGTVPAHFAGVWGPDADALPVTNVKLHLRMEDDISVPVGADSYKKVRAVQMTPGLSAIAYGATDWEISHGWYRDFASPVSIISSSTLSGDERAVSDVAIFENQFHGCLASCVTADGDRIHVYRNRMTGYAANPLLSYDAVSIHCGRWNTVTDNLISGFANAGGIGIHIRSSNSTDGPIAGSTSILVARNTLEDMDNSFAMKATSTTGETTYGVTNVSFVDNLVRNSRRCLQIAPSGDKGMPFRGFVVTGNQCSVYERGLDLVGNAATSKIVSLVASGNVVRVVADGSGAKITGTVSISAGATALSGVGTLFLSELVVGEWLEIDGQPVKVSAVATDTSATVTAFPGSAAVAAYAAHKLGAGITAANSWAIRFSTIERGTFTGNTAFIVNGAASIYSGLISTLRNVDMSGNRFYAADGTWASFTMSTVTQSSFTNNAVTGLASIAAGGFSFGTAGGNRFATATSTFNGHDVAGVAFGVDETKFWKYGTAAPASETWAQGDRVINTAPTSGGAFQWVCTTGGSPGTWTAHALP